MTGIVLADTDRSLVNVLQDTLVQAGLPVLPVTSGSALLTVFAGGPPELVVLARDLPDDGDALLPRIRSNAETRDVPVILTSGPVAPADRAAQLTAGANDYLIKPFAPAELLARVRVQLRMAAQRGKLRAELDRVRSLASIDSLTGIPNRRALEKHLASEADRFESGSLAIVTLDIDRFKHVNDSGGHLLGDTAIATVARAMVGVTRLSDFVARLGGDEFVVVLSGGTGAAAIATAERIRSNIGLVMASSPLDGYGLTISAGVAVAAPGDTAEQVLRRADSALSLAKRLGGDQVVAA